MPALQPAAPQRRQAVAFRSLPPRSTRMLCRAGPKATTAAHGKGGRAPAAAGAGQLRLGAARRAAADAQRLAAEVGGPCMQQTRIRLLCSTCRALQGGPPYGLACLCDPPAPGGQLSHSAAPDLQLLAAPGTKLAGSALLATLAGLAACHPAEASAVLGNLQQAAFIPGESLRGQLWWCACVH